MPRRTPRPTQARGRHDLAAPAGRTTAPWARAAAMVGAAATGGRAVEVAAGRLPGSPE